LWLVTEYHALGSVCDYLSEHAVTRDGMCRMVRSIASGLMFLHSAIDAVAHSRLF
jgi:hypothetical protein